MPHMYLEMKLNDQIARPTWIIEILVNKSYKPKFSNKLNQLKKKKTEAKVNDLKKFTLKPYNQSGSPLSTILIRSPKFNLNSGLVVYSWMTMWDPCKAEKYFLGR